MKIARLSNACQEPSLAELGPARYNSTHGSHSDLEGHARDGPQRRQKGWEKGCENPRRSSHSGAAEPDCKKSSKSSVGQSKDEGPRSDEAVAHVTLCKVKPMRTHPE